MAIYARASGLASLLEPFRQYEVGAPARAAADMARTDFVEHARLEGTNAGWSDS